MKKLYIILSFLSCLSMSACTDITQPLSDSTKDLQVDIQSTWDAILFSPLEMNKWEYTVSFVWTGDTTINPDTSDMRTVSANLYKLDIPKYNIKYVFPLMEGRDSDLENWQWVENGVIRFPDSQLRKKANLRQYRFSAQENDWLLRSKSSVIKNLVRLILGIDEFPNKLAKEMYRCSESLPSDETGEIYDSYFQRRDFICNNWALPELSLSNFSWENLKFYGYSFGRNHYLPEERKELIQSYFYTIHVFLDSVNPGVVRVYSHNPIKD